MKSAFDKIAVGIEDAIAFKNGDASRGRIANPDVKMVRDALSDHHGDGHYLMSIDWRQEVRDALSRDGVSDAGGLQVRDFVHLDWKP